jgi:hypothetical protein
MNYSIDNLPKIIGKWLRPNFIIFFGLLEKDLQIGGLFLFSQAM